ncbi:MAG: ankyrin repeat domain-containing protein [Elusimicrobiales bacterium]|nr:ankyrin repeat domain-containing protein [Elusimicrobiales bacterium]
MESMNEMEKQLKELMENGEFEKALSLSNEVLKAYPQEAKPYFLKACVLWNKSEVFDLPREEFSDLLKKATDLDPHFSAPHKLWAYANLLLGYPDMAETGYTRAIEADPQDLDAYCERGEVRMRLGKHQEAIEDFTVVINAGEGGNRAYAFRADSYLALKNYDAAEKDYLKATELESGYGGGYFGIGQIRMAQNNFEAAIENFSKTIEMFPDYSPAYGLRGNAKTQTGDILGALEDFQKALDLSPEDENALIAVQTLQNDLLSEVPAGTHYMRVTLKNGRKAMIVPIDGTPVTMYDLEPAKEPDEKITEGELSETEEQSAEGPVLAETDPVDPARARELGKQLIRECGFGHLDKVRELIDAGADLNLELFSETPLLKAIKGKYAEVVKVLLESGADVNAVTKSGKTALDTAVVWEDSSVLEVLLAHTGINVNATDSGGNTALMTAAKAGKLTALKMLLAAGAGLNVKNKRGQTALGLARSCNRAEAAELLAAAGAAE